MKHFRVLCLAAALLCSTAAFAQQAADGNPPTDLKSQMSSEQFKAAGLDKLDASELAALNDWLNKKVVAQTAIVAAAAKEEGRKEVVQENRGFFDFGTSEPIESTLTGDFNGFGKGKTYVLANGQEWQQTDAATLAGVRKSSPEVSIKPGTLGVWYMRVKGYNTTAKVQRIK
ncbi:hypothetical protein [Pseudoxanthomonas dokdonensis]|uniref:Secreted protein n=1 Tax=Pseudoxanthomonas dokdonensis TaxID=344882 RepID=A0A0R0D008_9GAMM|nr:hypothetical protein [Pseudoxanthomonas dokdonensis]KRG71473.1 hypothetical protein ABB29_01465 [Pseudoxanthomonas dokdonensis]